MIKLKILLLQISKSDVFTFALRHTQLIYNTEYQNNNCSHDICDEIKLNYLHHITQFCFHMTTEKKSQGMMSGDLTSQ